MSQDKQLSQVNLEQVQTKRRLGQALNVKEFAVLAGMSYSNARAWFRTTGFPAIRGIVFWDDFVIWRRTQTGLEWTQPEVAPTLPLPRESQPMRSESKRIWPERAAKILAEVD